MEWRTTMNTPFLLGKLGWIYANMEELPPDSVVRKILPNTGRSSCIAHYFRVLFDAKKIELDQQTARTTRVFLELTTPIAFPTSRWGKKLPDMKAPKTGLARWASDHIEYGCQAFPPTKVFSCNLFRFPVLASTTICYPLISAFTLLSPASQNCRFSRSKNLFKTQITRRFLAKEYFSSFKVKRAEKLHEKAAPSSSYWLHGEWFLRREDKSDNLNSQNWQDHWILLFINHWISTIFLLKTEGDKIVPSFIWEWNALTKTTIWKNYLIQFKWNWAHF